MVSMIGGRAPGKNSVNLVVLIVTFLGPFFVIRHCNSNYPDSFFDINLSCTIHQALGRNAREEYFGKFRQGPGKGRQDAWVPCSALLFMRYFPVPPASKRQQIQLCDVWREAILQKSMQYTGLGWELDFFFVLYWWLRKFCFQSELELSEWCWWKTLYPWGFGAVVMR